MVMVAKPGSGKSTLLENLLTRKEYYRRKFDNIYAFIPSNSFASLPEKSLLKKHDKVYDNLNIETLDKIMQKIYKSAADEENSLLVIDDQLHALKDVELLRQLEMIFSNRRHLRTSTIISTQVWNSLPLILRKVLSHAIVWKVGSGKEQASILEEAFPGTKKEDAEELLRMAHKGRHDFLLIDLVNGKYWNSDLDELVIVDA